MAARKEELQRIIAEARNELDEIEEAEARLSATEFVGRCFKYRNSFSCPKGPEDRWWVYAKVLDSEGGALQFQRDKNGMWRVEPEAYMSTRNGSVGAGWYEIEPEEFDDECKKAIAEITAILTPLEAVTA